MKNLDKSKDLNKNIKKSISNKQQVINAKFKNLFINQEAVYELTNYKQSFGLFTRLFHIRKFYLRILIAVFVGVLLSLNSLFFIQSTNLYTAGLSGIFQGFARIALAQIPDKQTGQTVFFVLFYGGYFAANIPLAIFGYYKIGKKFAILSLVTLIVGNVIPITVNAIPGVTDWLNNDVNLFGSVKPFDNNGSQLEILLFNNTTDLAKFPSLILYGTISGIIAGVSYAIILIVSGSTGGIDFISFYYSIKKNKSIGTIVFYLNLISVFVSIFIGSFIPAGLAAGFSFDKFLSQNLVVSFLMIFFTFLTYNALFPKEKIVSVKIYGDKILDIVKFLNEKKFTHAMTINRSIGGFSGKDNYNLEIVCQYVELPQLLSDIKKVNSKALTVITIVKGIDGEMRFENRIRY